MRVQELDQFCVGVPHDHARGIRCLEDNSGQPTFSEQCRQEVAQHQHHLAEDYRCALLQIPLSNIPCLRDWYSIISDMTTMPVRCGYRIPKTLPIFFLSTSLRSPGPGTNANIRHFPGTRTSMGRRLNSRLTDACESAVAELCSAVACTEEAPCGGVMLRCLTDKVDQIQEPACKNVRYSYHQAFQCGVHVALWSVWSGPNSCTGSMQSAIRVQD